MPKTRISQSSSKNKKKRNNRIIIDIELFKRLFSKKKINKIGRETNFTQRIRKLSAYKFFLAITFGILREEKVSLSNLLEIIEENITIVSLYKRFNEKCCKFLQNIYEYTYQQIKQEVCSIEVNILKKFKRVNIIDSTSWKISEGLKDKYRGYNGAGCKMQLMIDYKTGMFELMEMIDEVEPDQRYAKGLKWRVRKGDLFIFDRGYGISNVFTEIDQRGGYFITRYNPHSVNIYKKVEEGYEKIDIWKLISNGENRRGVIEIKCYTKQGNKLRLLMYKVNEEVSNKRRRELYKKARKAGRRPSKLSLQLCNWCLIITNIEKEKGINYEQMLNLYSMRWQIEIIFKQLKSILKIDKSLVRKNEHRFMAEIWGKCIVALFISYCYSVARNQVWKDRQIEISFEKMVKCFKRNIGIMIEKLKEGIKEVIKFIRWIMERIINTCQKYRQKSRDNSLDKLIKISENKRYNYMEISRITHLNFES